MADTFAATGVFGLAPAQNQGPRSRMVQDATNSFTNTTDVPAETDIGKPGGRLSVVGSITPERVEAISKANAARGSRSCIGDRVLVDLRTTGIRASRP